MLYFEKITTEEERAALPVGTHVLDASGDGMTKYGDQDWQLHQGARLHYDDSAIKLPIKVISYPSSHTITVTREYFDNLANSRGTPTSQDLIDWKVEGVMYF